MCDTLLGALRALMIYVLGAYLQLIGNSRLRVGIDSMRPLLPTILLFLFASSMFSPLMNANATP